MITKSRIPVDVHGGTSAESGTRGNTVKVHVCELPDGVDWACRTIDNITHVMISPEAEARWDEELQSTVSGDVDVVVTVCELPEQVEWVRQRVGDTLYVLITPELGRAREELERTGVL